MWRGNEGLSASLQKYPHLSGCVYFRNPPGKFNPEFFAKPIDAMHGVMVK